MKDLPEGFKTMMRELMGVESDSLIDALQLPPVVSVRLNKRKHIDQFDSCEKVPWCESGYYLESRPEFIFDPLLHAGAYYVQDASSMIYETVTKQIVEIFAKESDCNPCLHVLDLCAAPGGKTTAIINSLPDNSSIVANEYVRKRLPALQENIERWGFPNVKITNHDVSFFSKQGVLYDIVAVDAPCSGEGMMRKEEVARTQWSHELIQQCSSLQKDILRNAVEALKPGGFLIYSTCTFNRKENEDNAEYIKSELRLKPYDLDLSPDWNISKGYDTDIPCYRFMPHKTKGEGLFLSVFRKPGDWHHSSSKINSILCNQDAELPKVEISRELAVSYLRGESIILPENAPLGLLTVCYKGFPLGKAKNIGKRANNLYPKNKRILKRF